MRDVHDAADAGRLCYRVRGTSMTSELAVHVYEDVDDAALQLHVRPGPGAHCALFGWKLPPTHIDAGPAAALAAAFAAALASCGTLAFLETPSPRRRRVLGWFTDGGDAWLAVPASLGDRLRRRPPPWFRATDSAERAGRLFDGSISWDQQAQVGLLLRRDSRPLLDRSLLRSVIHARRIDVAELQLPGDVLALALPAVDGDYLEIVARVVTTRDAICHAITAECARRDIPCEARSWRPLTSLPSHAAAKPPP